MSRICVIPGTFDPVTNGHADIIERASHLFDRVVVASLINAAKKPLFPLEERLDLLRCVAARYPNVEVSTFDGLTVDFCRQIGACAIVKGLRAVSDFDYEYQQASLNRHMAPGIESVFLMTDTKYAFLSSSIVREIGRLGGDIRAFVPAEIHDQIVARLS